MMRLIPTIKVLTRIPKLHNIRIHPPPIHQHNMRQPPHHPNCLPRHRPNRLPNQILIHIIQPHIKPILIRLRILLLMLRDMHPTPPRRKRPLIHRQSVPGNGCPGPGAGWLRGRCSRREECDCWWSRKALLKREGIAAQHTRGCQGFRNNSRQTSGRPPKCTARAWRIRRLAADKAPGAVQSASLIASNSVPWNRPGCSR